MFIGCVTYVGRSCCWMARDKETKTYTRDTLTQLTYIRLYIRCSVLQCVAVWLQHTATHCKGHTDTIYLYTSVHTTLASVDFFLYLGSSCCWVARKKDTTTYTTEYARVTLAHPTERHRVMGCLMWALYLVALLRKLTCNLRHPPGLCHPVPHLLTTTPTNIHTNQKMRPDYVQKRTDVETYMHKNIYIRTHDANYLYTREHIHTTNKRAIYPCIPEYIHTNKQCNLGVHTKICTHKKRCELPVSTRTYTREKKCDLPIYKRKYTQE